jgi:hypothetical protein
MGKGNAFTLVAVIVVAAIVGPALTAQAPPQRQGPAPGDPAVDLLAEVRALRAELAAASRASLRTQLLVARVQLQEQRIIYFDRRRAELAESVARAAERTGEAEENANRMEQQLQALRNPSFGSPKMSEAERDAMRRDFEMMTATARRELQAAQQHESRLRAEESEVVNALSAEQGRWSDFNARLDEIERTLPAR